MIPKSKVAPVHAMKAYRGSTGIDPFILNTGTSWKSVKGKVYPRTCHEGPEGE